MGRCKKVSQSRPQLTAASPCVRNKSRCRPSPEKPNIVTKFAPQSAGTGSLTVKGRLLCESRRNKTLRGEIKQLRVTLEMNRKMIREKSSNIQLKHEKINGLMKTTADIDTGRHATEANNEDEYIDNLLKANLGISTVKEILSMTEATFPVDLVDLDFSLHDDQQEYQSLITTKAVKEMKHEICSDKMKVPQLMQINEAKYIKEDQSSGEQEQDSNVPYKLSTCSTEAILSSCPHCAKTFPRGSQFLEHLQQYHNLNPYHCQNCKKQFPSMSILTAHERRHKLMHPFKCRKCGYKPGSLTSFVKHVKSAHGVRVTSIGCVRNMLVLSTNYEYV